MSWASNTVGSMCIVVWMVYMVAVNSFWAFGTLKEGNLSKFESARSLMV